MYRVLTLNHIAPAGLERLPRDRYEVASELGDPDAVLVRSADMHSVELPGSVIAIGRAGAGVNNIPLDACSGRGIAVFNAPGANANAVKEMVLGAMLIASRHLTAAWAHVHSLDEAGAALAAAVEDGKRRFAGTEIAGRTLGVIGLGAVGVQVANAARALGMHVVGHDPQMTVDHAWQLDAAVERAGSVDEVLGKADFVTLHVPLLDATRSLIDERRLGVMKPGAILLNFARAEIVDTEAVTGSLGNGRLRAYMTDFPSEALRGVPGAIAFPHLGASTEEAQVNCAVMVADRVRAYLEDGTVADSVNLPSASMPRADGTRLAAVHANVPNMLGQLSTVLARAELNIIDMLNRSRGELAYTLLDVEGELPDGVLAEVAAIDGMRAVRVPA